LSYRKGDPIANFCMNYLTKEVISDYLSLLKDVLTENNLFKCPTILMKRESFWMVMPRLRVIAKRGQKKVRYRISGWKNLWT